MKKIRPLPGLVAVLAAGLVLTSCSSDDPTEAAAAPTSTDSSAASEAPEPDTSTSPSPTEDAPAPPISSGRHEAGALSAQFLACEVRGASFSAPDSNKVVPGLAADGDLLYVLDAEGRVHRFTTSLGGSCTLDLDTSWAEAGVYTPRAEQVSAISVAGGRMALSGGVFGLEVLDLATMTSVQCAGAGTFRLSRDGRTGLGHFPGSPLKQLVVNDTNCQVTDAAVGKELPFAEGTVQALAYDGKELLLAGPDADETVKVARASGTGAVKWLHGAETDEARFGWVHGIAPCGPGVCTVDTNYKRMQLRDADGTWMTSIDLQDVLQVDGSAWWTGVAPTHRGGLWMSMGVTPTGGSQAVGAIVRVAFPD